jgi:S-adenosyl methyltransferase
MTGDPGWAPPGVDTTRANTARVYDYWLGGTHNFLPDQDLARAIVAVNPFMRDIVRANREFLSRAIRFLAAAGITQFLDIGSGIPTQGNVHEVAQQASPGARVVYVDTDPVAIAHSKAILAGNPDTAVIDADLREPEKILAHEVTRQLLDLSQPTALILGAVLHFIGDEEDPNGIIATLRDGLAPGSYLAVSHATDDESTGLVQATGKVYNSKSAVHLRMRSYPEVCRFFDGFELVDPGVVWLPLWRPDAPADVPADPSRFAGWVGVGRKPV